MKYLLIIMLIFSGCGMDENIDRDGDGWTNDMDCGPDNALINPAQEEFFTEPVEGILNHFPFDYNCDGIEETEFNVTGPHGWEQSTIPACGEIGRWSSYTGMGSTGRDKVQPCR